MAEDAPQLYLMTPVAAQASSLAPVLEAMLDRFAPACIRIPGAGDADSLGRIADLVRDLAHARDIAVVIDDHVQLAQSHGLDGVHLTRPTAKAVHDARKTLGADAIIGVYAGPSRHEGMNLGEAGADYVSFGPVGDDGLGDGETAPIDLFQWWSEVIELPIVAEGGLTPALYAQLAPISDFIAIGPEIWGRDDPLAALAEIWPS